MGMLEGYLVICCIDTENNIYGGGYTREFRILTYQPKCRWVRRKEPSATQFVVCAAPHQYYSASKTYRSLELRIIKSPVSERLSGDLVAIPEETGFKPERVQAAGDDFLQRRGGRSWKRELVQYTCLRIRRTPREAITGCR